MAIGKQRQKAQISDVNSMSGCRVLWPSLAGQIGCGSTADGWNGCKGGLAGAVLALGTKVLLAWLGILLCWMVERSHHISTGGLAESVGL